MLRDSPPPPFLKSGILSSVFFYPALRILAFFWGVLRSILGVLLKTRFPYCRCRRRTLIFFSRYGCRCWNICRVRAVFYG